MGKGGDLADHVEFGQQQRRTFSQWLQSLYNHRPSSSTISLQIHEQIKRLATIRIKDAIMGLGSQERGVGGILFLKHREDRIDV